MSKFNSNPSVGGSNNFLKIEPGKSVSAVIRGDVHEFYVQWDNGRSTICRQQDAGAKFRFRVNLVYLENNVMVSKIWEQGATVYHMLKELAAEYDLDSTMLKIKRDGAGKETSYSIIPMAKGLTKEQVDKVAAVALHELTLKLAGAQENQEAADEDIILF